MLLNKTTHPQTEKVNIRRALVKKLRRTQWWISGIFAKHKRALGLTFGIGLLLMAILAPFVPRLIHNYSIERIKIGLVSLSTPSDLPLSVQEILSQGLTQIDISGEVKPALATSWQISEDGKIYTFQLRRDVSWHDGTPFTANDINYNLKEVEFIPSDTYELKVKLKEPFIPLPAFLSKPLFKKGLIGVGSYKVKDVKLKGEQVAYLKLIPATPDLPQLEIKFFPTEQIAKTAFKLGEINVIDEIIDPAPFDTWQSMEIKETPMNQHIVGVFFNLNDNLMKQKEIRQALAYAAPKQETNRLLTPLSRTSWAYTARVKTYEQDMEQAKKLVGTDVPQDELVLSTVSQFLTLANSIAASWKSLGFNVKVKTVDTLTDGFQALLVSMEIPFDPDQYPLWHSTQTDTNLTGYSDPKIDKLLEDGRKETDIEKRKELYADFQRYLVDDAPAIFLFHPTLYTVIRR